MRFLRCRREAVPPSTGWRVAVVGAGPAGLGAAGWLRCRGHEVVVYDAAPEPGGMVLYGIPVTRIPKEPLRRGVRELAEAGVRFVLRTRVGSPGGRGLEVLEPAGSVSLEGLIREFDAVLIATGTWRTRRMGVEGEDLPWVYPAMEWLVTLHMAMYGYKPPDSVPPLEGRVLVVGGGLTAADAVMVPLTYERFKGRVREVVLSYRRTRELAPMGAREVDSLVKRGARFWGLTQPVEFREEGGRRVVRFLRMRLAEADSSGRPRPVPVEGSEFEEEFDYVLKAVGVEPTPPIEPGCCGIEVNPDGTIKTDENYMTTRPGVFAAGDVRHGPSLIGPALKSGLDAAARIHEYLASKS
ncbi:FAD-dependent oxidoreductase [Stetteria hydrogenophila]